MQNEPVWNYKSKAIRKLRIGKRTQLNYLISTSRNGFKNKSVKRINWIAWETRAELRGYID